MLPDLAAVFATQAPPSSETSMPPPDAPTVEAAGRRAPGKETGMNLNLKWLLIFASSLAGLAVCAMLGLLGSLWQADTTKISFVIIGLYLVVSPFIGWLTAHAPQRAVADYRRACRFTPELMTGLGMLGTVIGFLMMLGPAFSGLDVNNVQSTQAALGRMASGMAVALTTTLAGLACSMVLQLQLVNLDIVRR
jgi:hypothetical protein